MHNKYFLRAIQVAYLWVYKKCQYICQFFMKTVSSKKVYVEHLTRNTAFFACGPVISAFSGPALSGFAFSSPAF